MNRTLLALLIAVAPAVLMAQLPEYVPSEGLEFWSDFDGDAENEGLQSVSSSIYGAQPVANRNGEANQALTFDGQDDYVLLYGEEGGISFGESLTLAAWVRPASSILNGTHSRIFNSTEGVGAGPDRWLFTWSPPEHEEKMQFQVDPSGSNGPYGSTPLTVGEWSHVAMVFDQGQVAFYHNGVADGSATIANNSLAHVLAPIQIGSANGNSFFHGDLDDVGIWSQALTASQIQALFEAETNACVPPLELQGVTVLSAPTSRYAGDGVIAISVSTGQPASLSIVNLGGSSSEVIPFTESINEVGAGIYAISVQDSDGCSSDTLAVMMPYELCCECGVSDVDTDGICDDDDNCADRTALNYADPNNADCYECGNGLVELGETCDDSNTECGDGCCNCILQEMEAIQVGQDIHGTLPSERFGSSVAISSTGYHIAIGGVEGRVQVYEWIENNWVQIGSDIIGDRASLGYGSFAGRKSVALNQSTVACGFRSADGLDGVVQVFEWNGSEWVQRGQDIVSHFQSPYFGSCIEYGFNGLLTIGGGKDSVGGWTASVYAFSQNQQEWIQLGEDLPSSSKWVTANRFSSRVMAGNILYDYIGAEYFGDPSGNWLQSEAQIPMTGARAMSHLGNRVVCVSGGVGKVYELVGDQWVQMGGDLVTNQPPQYVGASVSMYRDGTIVAIGNPSANDATGNNHATGQISLFKWTGEQWVGFGPTIDGEYYWNFSGYSIAIAPYFNPELGLRLIAGSPFNDGIDFPDFNGYNQDTGQARVYTFLPEE